MKKFVFLGAVVLGMSSQSLAWDISIPGTTIKGDDPQVVKDVTEGTKHAVTQIINTTRDATAVGRIAGAIVDVIDSNKDVLVSAGSLRACLATLCYSEVLKKQQIEQAEHDARKQCNAQIAQTKAYYDKLSKETRIQELQKSLNESNDRKNILTQHAQVLTAEHEILEKVFKAVLSEMNYRQALSNNGIKTIPIPANNEMQQPTADFTDRMEKDYKGALSKINADIDRLTSITGRTRERLMAEFIRLLKWEPLKNFSDRIKEQLDQNQNVHVGVALELDRATADAEWANKQLAVEQGTK
ncbi:MAG: hypothetical protein ACXVCY_12200 [Pseudobdellovibrionaceae bacterium]